VRNNLLARYLRTNGETPPDFARRIGVRRATVWRWLNGQRVPDRTSAIIIEHATNGDVTVGSWAPPVKAPLVRRRKPAHATA
jgi:DNA-binding transcriptional regulator YdaS (Cro superfamily)